MAKLAIVPHFDFYEYLHFLKAEIYQINNFQSPLNSKNCFHVKSEWQKNHEFSTLCEICSCKCNLNTFVLKFNYEKLSLKKIGVDLINLTKKMLESMILSVFPTLDISNWFHEKMSQVVEFLQNC